MEYWVVGEKSEEVGPQPQTLRGNTGASICPCLFYIHLYQRGQERNRVQRSKILYYPKRSPLSSHLACRFLSSKGPLKFFCSDNKRKLSSHGEKVGR